MTPICVIFCVVAVVFLKGFAPSEATQYAVRAGETAELAKPPNNFGSNVQYTVSRDGEQIPYGSKYQMRGTHFRITNVTTEDVGQYRWTIRSPYYGNRRYHDDQLYVIESIRGSVLEPPFTYSRRKTLVCKYRYHGDGQHLTGMYAVLGNGNLTPNSTTVDDEDDDYITTAFYNLTYVTEVSFRCGIESSRSPLVSDPVQTTIFDRLALRGRTFKAAVGISDYRYFGLDANDVPVLAGNRPGFLIPGHSDHYHVTSQDDISDNETVVKFNIPAVGFGDAGTYRWFIFGHETLERMNLIVVGEPEIVVPDRVVAGETLQLQCRVQYHDGNIDAEDELQIQVEGLIDNNTLSEINQSLNIGPNSTTIIQTYEIRVCADHHLQTFSCRVQRDGNPHEIIEAATELHVLYPPTWVEISPLPRGGEYIVDNTLECYADANPPPEYLWTNNKTGVSHVGSELHLNSSFVGKDESAWQCTATNVIHGRARNASSRILFRTVVVQNLSVAGHCLVRAGGFATVTAQVHMLNGDLLGVENNDQVLVTGGGPYMNNSRTSDKYVLAVDGPSVHLLVRNAALEDSGSYRWSIFGTKAVARTNVIVAETPECLISGDLVAGQEVDLACRVRFGVGSSPEIRAEKYPKAFDGILAGRPLTAISSTVQKENGTVLLSKVFRETVISEWHLQVFTCRLSMTGDADEHVQNTATLRVTE